MPTTQMRVRVPQVADIKAAIRIYYERTEIGNADIKAIFGPMCDGRIARLKQLALVAMKERGVPHYNARYVNTETAYDVWGIDIKRLERGIEKLAKLNIGDE